MRALSWQQADELFKRFDAISPYDPKIIPHLFRKEDVNFSADRMQMELRYFGIASKRYVGFRGDPRNPQIIKPSQHGVGCYFKPDKRKWVKPRDCANEEKDPALAFDDWEHILKQQYAAHTDGHHPFLNHLAMRKVRVNTPRELAALRKLDPDKARPFNFCLSRFQNCSCSFKKQYGQSLEVKLHQKEVHDRAIVIDDRDFFALGASIKDLGDKLSLLNKLEDHANVVRLRNEFRTIWAAATAL